eukprot:4401675-Pyramimonas_sp.AAC.1
MCVLALAPRTFVVKVCSSSPDGGNAVLASAPCAFVLTVRSSFMDPSGRSPSNSVLVRCGDAAVTLICSAKAPGMDF